MGQGRGDGADGEGTGLAEGAGLAERAGLAEPVARGEGEDAVPGGTSCASEEPERLGVLLGPAVSGARAVHPARSAAASSSAAGAP